MGRRTILTILILTAIGQNCILGIRFGRNKVEVIHRGKTLQDLVMLDSRVAPHDLDNLHAFVQPKLLEESKDEGMMLQENGIEDFRPLDVTIETDEGSHRGKKHHKRVDQMSVSHTGDNDEGYNLRDMPEYNLETKADFEGNQEAVDWLMKDPNDYNVKSFEDSDALEDTDNFDSNMDLTDIEDQHRTNALQRKKGKERHKGTIKLPSNSQSLQDYDQMGDDTDFLLSKIDAETGAHRGKATKSTDNYNDFPQSDYSEHENSDHGYKSWNENVDDVSDGTTGRTFDEFDSNSEASSRKSLQERIKNQDTKLFREIENYNKGDYYENSDYLDNFDSYGDEFKNTIGTVHNETADDKSDDEDDTSSEKDGNSDRFQDEDALGNNHEWNSEESSHAGDKIDAEKLEDTDNEEDSDASGSLSDNTDDSPHSEMEDEMNEKSRENAKAKSMNSDQQVEDINIDNVNGDSKVQGAEEEVAHSNRNDSRIQTLHGIASGEGNHLSESKDEKIINEGQHIQLATYKENKMPANNTLSHHTTAISSNGNDNHSKTLNLEVDKIGKSAKILWIPAKSEIKGFQLSDSDEQLVPLSGPEVIGEIKKGSKTEQSHNESQSQKEKVKSKSSDEQLQIVQKVNDLLREVEESPHARIRATLKIPKLDHRKTFPYHNRRMRSHRKNNKPTSTGFRRNEENYRPSPPWSYSTADLTNIEHIISFLRGTTSSLSFPTRSSRPTNVSLKSLYYYPLHPTPEDENDGGYADTKDATFGEWNEWSSCSVTCGKGVIVRARVCLVNTCPPKDLFQSKRCHEDICADEVEREALKEHNRLRAKHFSPPLSWSASLARKARKIAQSLAGKDFLTLDDLQEQQGESVAQIVYTGESTITKAIEKWYKEIGSYSFSYPKINSKTRHFAQITWKGTKEMGLAIRRSGSGEYAFVVALYDPPVSSEGHLQQNILPPGLRHDLYSTIR